MPHRLSELVQCRKGNLFHFCVCSPQFSIHCKQFLIALGNLAQEFDSIEGKSNLVRDRPLELDIGIAEWYVLPGSE